MHLLLCLAHQRNMATSSKKTKTTKEQFFLHYGLKNLYFLSNNLSWEKADRLNSIILARCYWFLRNNLLTISKWKITCFSFECWLQNLLCQLLAERVDKRYLFHRSLITLNLLVLILWDRFLLLTCTIFYFLRYHSKY